MQAPAWRYDPVAITLHWAIALLMICMLAFGFLLSSIPPEYKILAFNMHKSFGLIVLALSVFRLIWRLLNPPPPLPLTMDWFDRFLAHSAHWCLYALIIGIPLSGWLMVSATPKYPIDFLMTGLEAPFLPMPQLADAKHTGHQFAELHYYLALLCVALIVLHVLAALKHHFFSKDGVLLRMLP